MAINDILAAGTKMGAVTLRVADLDLMTSFYQNAVSLSLLVQHDGHSILGRGGLPIVILEHTPTLRHAGPGQAGLFHTAILFETQAALAQAVYGVMSHDRKSFTGAADHTVSNAFYFTDPEGNALELYWDRDRSKWSWTHGQIDITSLELDPNKFLHDNLDRNAPLSAADSRASVGHIHLSVGDIKTAREFYVERLGFETTATVGTAALFVSAGHYHHHRAMNTFNSAGAGKRRLSLGLALVRIEVPTTDDLGALGERLAHSRVHTRHDGQTLSFDDPWANRIEVSTS